MNTYKIVWDKWPDASKTVPYEPPGEDKCLWAYRLVLSNYSGFGAGTVLKSYRAGPADIEVVLSYCDKDYRCCVRDVTEVDDV